MSSSLNTSAIEDFQPSRQRTEELLTKLVDVSKSNNGTSHLEDALAALPRGSSAALIQLATILEGQLSETDDQNSKDLGDCVETLADASREISWRRPFGPALGGLDNSRNPCILGIAITAISKGNCDKHLLKHSLRLIANCCADDDVNRAFVISHGCLTKMIWLMSISKAGQIEPDFLVVAVYNICLNFKDPTHDDSKPTIPNAAEKQLAGGRGKDDESSITVLLDIVDSISDDRKELLACLLETACRYARSGDLGFLHSPSDRPNTNNGIALHETVVRGLFGRSASLIAKHSLECCVSVCNAIISLLSQEVLRKSIISLSLVYNLMMMPYEFDEREMEGADNDEDEEASALKDILNSRKLILKLLFETTALPDFTNRFSLSDAWVKLCIEKFMALDVQDTDTCRPSLTYLCLVLANLTTSISAAEVLIKEYFIHTKLSEVLQTTTDHDLLFVTIGLLVKLALSDSNRVLLVDSNILERLCRVMTLQPSLEVLREVVVAVRLLVKGRPSYVRLLGETSILDSSDTSKITLLAAVLDCFSHTKDGATKIEVGRLMIEICRTLFGEPDASEQYLRLIGSNGSIAADAIAFVARFGQGGAQPEGWFGLALLSSWENTRTTLLDALQKDDLLKELKKVVATHEGPSYENARLMLAKLLVDSKQKVSLESYLEIEAAARDAGLSSYAA